MVVACQSRRCCSGLSVSHVRSSKLNNRPLYKPKSSWRSMSSCAERAKVLFYGTWETRCYNKAQKIKKEIIKWSNIKDKLYSNFVVLEPGSCRMTPPWALSIRLQSAAGTGGRAEPWSDKNEACYEVISTSLRRNLHYHSLSLSLSH